LRQVIRPIQCTGTNVKFYSELAVHNNLQYYLGLGKTTKHQDQFR
jgi:hypothetical protein